jgi:hypothetical protein
MDLVACKTVAVFTSLNFGIYDLIFAKLNINQFE